MNNTLLIHSDNVPSLENFSHKIKFDLSSSDIDSYISDNIIPKIKEHTVDTICIKDSLSLNYMDFYGLRVAYHIRLSQELDETRFIPIVILSDLDGYILNKLNPMGRILFTKNIFIIPNQWKSILSLKDKQFEISYDEKLELDFLSHIEINPPEDSTNHSIANKWAIYKWSNFLNIQNESTIQVNNAAISSTLYFKYLQALHHKRIDHKRKPLIKVPKNNGKILYIDDEWDKGWNNILHQLLSRNNNIDFSTFEYNYKDINKFTLTRDIKEEVLNKNPDVVLLDLRLSKTDHDEIEDLDRLTGIKVLKMIKEINPGIQIIMLTATSQSIILEKLYDYGILGYIKKEHPNDLTITTKDNVNKLVALVDNGLSKKYLKSIWEIQQNILALDLFKYEKYAPIKIEITSIFEIQNSNIENKNKYTLLAIFKCIELLNSLYIKEKNRISYWRDTNIPIKEIEGKSITEKNKILNVLHGRLSLFKFDETIRELVCSRNYAIHPINNCGEITITDPNYTNILRWFSMLENILIRI